MRRLAILLPLSVLCAAPLHAATVFATTFGEPGDTYQTSTGTAWAIGGTGDTGRAAGFVVATAYDLTQVRVADNFFSAANTAANNTLTVGIWQNTTNDMNGATLLEAFTFTTAVIATPAIFTGTSILHPLILPGDFYFISETVPIDPVASAVWGWQWNDQGALGFVVEHGGGSWGPSTATTPTTPAFEISGNAVPEPAVGWLAGGLCLLAFTQRRRWVSPSR